MKLIAKAFSTTHGFKGSRAEGVRAILTGDSSVKVHFGESRKMVDLVIGQHFSADSILYGEDPHSKISGVVEMGASNALRIGDHWIPMGARLDFQYHAVKIQSEFDGVNRYLVKSRDGKNTKVNVGQQYNEFGVVSEDSYGNLNMSGTLNSVLVLPKLNEINLVVFDKQGPNGKGYEAFMNYLDSETSQGNTSGTKGIFYPSFNNKPAKFTEVLSPEQMTSFGLDPKGVKSFATAVFFNAPYDSYVNVKARGLEDAVSERRLFLEIKKQEEIITAHSKMLGIAKEEHPDHDQFLKKKELLDYYNNDCYVTRGFVITEGADLLRTRSSAKRSAHGPKLSAPAP